MDNVMSEYIARIIFVVLLAAAAFFGIQMKKLYKKHVDTEVKQSLCKTAVRFVEQVYKDIHGSEKLHKAMAKASELLAEYGIKISDIELVAMIESAVNEFNNNFGRDVEPDVEK